MNTLDGYTLPLDVRVVEVGARVIVAEGHEGAADTRIRTQTIAMRAHTARVIGELVATLEKARQW